MSSYSQTITELFDLQKYAIKLGLDNILALTTACGNPHEQYPVIHIAGTNGKGSTAFYIANILQECGLKVGLFTSPHLADFRERIRVNNTLIDKNYIIDFWKNVKDNVLNLKATFFDTTALMAFKYFADEHVDIAVIETGLGGRLDSTNIVKSHSVAITPIAIDHQKQLGDDIVSIAGEKAGIIKESAYVFCAQQSAEVLNVLRKRTDRTNPFFYLPDFYKCTITDFNLTGLSFLINDLKENMSHSIFIPTPAQYQADNLSLALLVCREYCKNNHIKWDPLKIQHSIKKCSWPGRLQVIQDNPTIIFDVSHNYAGIKKSLESLLKLAEKEKLHLLLGIVNDKDAGEICDYLAGKFKKVTVTEPDTVRRQDGRLLLKLLQEKKQNVNFIKDLQTAYELCKEELNPGDTLIALGSHYLIGKLISG